MHGKSMRMTMESAPKKKKKQKKKTHSAECCFPRTKHKSKQENRMYCAAHSVAKRRYIYILLLLLISLQSILGVLIKTASRNMFVVRSASNQLRLPSSENCKNSSDWRMSVYIYFSRIFVPPRAPLPTVLRSAVYLLFDRFVSLHPTTSYAAGAADAYHCSFYFSK